MKRSSFPIQAFIPLIAFLVLSQVVFAQEVLTGLHINPVVKAGAMAGFNLKQVSEGTDTIPVMLPFFDDFSAGQVFPSSDRWIDRYAFENNDMPVFPINLGAITLDAINDSGSMYRDAVPGPAAFIADHLTSRYIRLDSVFSPVPRKLTPADSIYLSFYYQPQGRGLPPEVTDSLILQFLIRPAFDSITPTDTTPIPDQWERVWFSKGMALDTFLMNNGKYFIQVMIPITDASKFFKRQFRFQFFNYVSLTSSAEPSWQSNCDQWNLDNIYLNLERSRTDTIFPEIRFIERPPSMLARYESMPYPQYCDDPTNEIKDTIDVLISNRDLLEHVSAYNYWVNATTGSFSKTYSGGNDTLKPFYTHGYVTYPPFAHPPVNFLFPISQADSATFRMKHVIRDVTPGSVLGDTIEALQKFSNYYAYDDGTPEAGYGLTPAGAKLAYRFSLNKSPDTLRAIHFYFNKTLSKVNEVNFYLCVWNDNAGRPGDTIFSDLVYPRFTDTLNKFVTYHIDPPLHITGTFYVGWIQTTNDNLNVGFDRYNNRQQDILYNVAGAWNTSSFSGSLLIRPVVGKPIPVGIGEEGKAAENPLVYPNPCSGNTLTVKPPVASAGVQSKSLTVTVRNIYGQVMSRNQFTGTVDVTSLPAGLYFIELTGRNGNPAGAARFIRTR
jgi:hypothetical protein